MAHLVTEDEPGLFVMHDLVRLFARETCQTMISGDRGALKLPTPVARLYGMLINAGIDVNVYDSHQTWPDEQFAAMVSSDGIVFLNPSIENDDLLADILAFVTAVCCAIVVDDTAPEGYIAAPHGVVMIGRERLPEPPKGPGRLARMFAQQCGRDTASATFSIFPFPFELGT